MKNSYYEGLRSLSFEIFANGGQLQNIQYIHRVDREDIPIIILDPKLGPDFVLHACRFFTAGNRPVLTPPSSASKSLTYKNRRAKS